MKMRLSIQFSLLLIPVFGAFAQNAPLDIRIAERLKPSEANYLYKEYNDEAKNFNQIREFYKKEAKRSFWWNIVGGVAIGVLAYNFPTYDLETQPSKPIMAGAGFVVGFAGGRIFLGQNKRRIKADAMDSYKRALRKLPD